MSYVIYKATIFSNRPDITQMNILYIGLFRFPEGDAAASRVLNNARMFRDLGHYVKILSFGGEYREEDASVEGYVYDGMQYEITHDIDTHSWKERILRYTYPNPNARTYIIKYIDYYDVIITYNTTCPMNLFLQRICKTHKKKIVLDITEWPAPNEIPGGRLSPIFWLSELNMRYVQKRFKNLIPISHYLDNYYAKSNNLLLPPLINMYDSKWNVFKTTKMVELTEFDGIRLIFAGTPAKKDLLGNLIEALIQVLSYTSKIQLVVAGVSNKQAKQYCNEKALTEFKSNFVFLGRVPQSFVPSLYHISDFSTIIREPSRKNNAGFPTKMAESMAAGCPVFLNCTSDLGDYAIDGLSAIYIESYHVDSIRKGLFRILSIPKDQILKMKQTARQTGEQKFDYHKYMKKGEDFLKKLM